MFRHYGQTLLRQYVPKKTSFDLLNDNQILCYNKGKSTTAGLLIMMIGQQKQKMDVRD